MHLQRIFTKTYSEYLRKHINIDDYRQEVFPCDLKQVKLLANIYQPEGLIDRLDPNNDYQSGIAIYEAYRGISPLLASLPDLWIYLGHVDLFSYVQARHSEVLKETCTEDFVIDHWFQNRVSRFRMALPSGWWSVYLSIDNSREDPYELTKILYSNQEFRTNSFGSQILIRHREAMIGVLEFLSEHKELLEEGMNSRAQYIRILFNKIGGYKPIAFMDRQFFKDELEKRLGILSLRLSQDEVRNNPELYNAEI